jgi:hypothetical protein
MTKHSFTFICLLTALGYTPSFAKEDKVSLTLVEVLKIWDKAPHNAFTDLVRFKDEWFCTFREDKNHWSKGAAGKIRVLRSAEGEKWEPTGLISGEGDLRDPKLTVTPQNKLMLIYFRRFNPHRWPKQNEQQFAQFSEDGTQWGTPSEIGIPNSWLWRVTWHEGKAHGITQHGLKDRPPFGRPRKGLLLVSDNGKEFSTLADAADGGEATIRFGSEGSSYCLRRSINERDMGYWGQSKAPYRDWKWTRMNKRIGGPNFIILPDGHMIAAVRLYDGGARTSLCWLDPKAGTLTEALKLPSSGDTSYAGMVWYENMLWISYYSSHEGKTSIYLAKVQLGN